MSLFQDIHNIRLQDPKTIEQRVLKLMEETGEVSQELLAFLSVASCKHRSATAEDVGKECVDVIMCAYSILSHLSLDEDTIDALFAQKLSKWKSLVENEKT